MITLTLIGCIVICVIAIILITAFGVIFYLIIRSIHEEIMNPEKPHDNGEVSNIDK